MSIDYKKLNAELLARCPGILMTWFPAGKMLGHEFVVGNTSGEPGKSLSVNSRTGVWQDFATGDKGDLLQLYAYSTGLKNSEAAAQLIQQHTIRDIIEDAVMLPVPQGLHREAKTEGASLVHSYLNAKGELLFYMLRYDHAQRGKTFTPLSYWHDSGWQKKIPPGKRPLYGLQLLAKHFRSNVIIVEGEKCADAGIKLSSDYIFMTWPNGSSAYKQADWSVLAGRDVILWPDADDVGIKAMNGLVEILKKSKAKSICVLNVSSQSGGWDVADAVEEGWSSKQLDIWTDENRKLVYPLKDQPEHVGLENIHFRSLGYNGKSFLFYIQATGQVMAYKGTELEAKGNLYTLAPADYWTETYGDNKGMTANALIRQSEANGYYDPAIVRGRGVWEDDGRSVLHLGNKLIVDGTECDIRTFKTDYIYEQRVAMRVKTHEPINSSDATRLVDICNLVGWEESISGFLLAGWIFSSIICGVLPWRSHIYLTGPVGSGKTWVIENLINRCLRGIGLPVQGKSTEAGLRQLLKGDARPVLFDEAEKDTRENAARMQRIFDLARQASSEGAAPIVKGTSTQTGALEYVFRSCFVFASIQPSMTHYADESRITLLRLSNPYDGNAERFQKLLNARNRFLTDNFCDGLISRAVQMASITRHNCRVFAEAGEEKFGNRRAADQFAMMLSGLYGLMNDRELEDHEEAKEFILSEAFDWEGRLKETPIPSEVTLLETILQTEVQIQPGNERKMLGELVAGEVSSNGKFVDRDVLRRHGIKVVGEKLHIANNCVGLRRILRDTSWTDKWNETLINTPGAKKSHAGEFFAAGIQSRSVIIDMPESLRDRDEVV